MQMQEFPEKKMLSPNIQSTGWVYSFYVVCPSVTLQFPFSILSLNEWILISWYVKFYRHHVE